MKRSTVLSVLLCCVIVLFSLCFSVCADTPENRVFDQAGLFTPEQSASLEDSIEKLRANTKMDAVIVTTRDAQGKSSQAYADDYYDDNGFGSGKDYSGVLFLIDMDNREICISTTGQMINILTDQRIDSILDGCYDHVVNEQYAKAASRFLTDVQQYVKAGVPQGQYQYDTETGAVKVYRSLELHEAIIAAAVSFGVGGLGIFIVLRRYRKHVTTYRYPIKDMGKLRLLVQEDTFLNKTVTQRRIQTSSSGSSGGSSGGGGRSSTHSSSSGRSHGGGSRKF